MREYTIKLKDTFSGSITTKIKTLNNKQVEQIKKAIEKKIIKPYFDRQQQIAYNYLILSIDQNPTNKSN